MNLEESMQVIRQVLAIRNLQKQKPFLFFLDAKDGEWTGMVYLKDNTIIELCKSNSVYTTLSKLASKLKETIYNHSILEKGGIL